jgi:hypothetical protein
MLNLEKHGKCSKTNNKKQKFLKTIFKDKIKIKNSSKKLKNLPNNIEQTEFSVCKD